MQNLQIIDDLIASGDLEKALAELDRMVSAAPDDDNLLFVRGKLLWRLGRRAAATSDYAKAAAINPGSPAAMALEHARDVADFFNPDLYNP